MSTDSVVVNTSPLIVLFKSGQEELLPTLLFWSSQVVELLLDEAGEL